MFEMPLDRPEHDFEITWALFCIFQLGARLCVAVFSFTASTRRKSDATIAFAYNRHVVQVRNPCPPFILSLSEHFLTLDEPFDWLIKLVQSELTNDRKGLSEVLVCQSLTSRWSYFKSCSRLFQFCAKHFNIFRFFQKTKVNSSFWTNSASYILTKKP